jgi:hypothetical protein
VGGKSRNAGNKRTVVRWSVLGLLAAVVVMSRTNVEAAVQRPLIFGIYPGGAAGAVGPTGEPVPEDPARRLASLQALRAPGRPFVLHLYASFAGPGSPTPAQQVGSAISDYRANGFRVELVLTYRSRESDVSGFVSFVRSAVDSFGGDPGFVGLQVTNEANVTGAPNAADGYYRGVGDALVRGVIAAKAESSAKRFDQIAVGFNWAYSLDRREARFWRSLRQRGGSVFSRSLDWVGVDVYPETWGPRAGRSADLSSATAKTMVRAFASLRKRFIPLAGLPASIALHVSENGYPTGRTRTEAMQTTVLLAAIRTVCAQRSKYNITDYRWFDLRDANSASPSIEAHYGLMRDDYAPKAAFAVYRRSIANACGS